MENIKLIKIKTIFFKIRDMLDSHEKRLEMLHSKCRNEFSKEVVLFSYRKIKGLREQFLACNVEYRDGIPYFLNTNIIYPYIDLTSEVYYIQNYKKGR